MTQELYVPLVKKLGFEYSEQDNDDTNELRTRAIEQAALAKDPEYVNFDEFVDVAHRLDMQHDPAAATAFHEICRDRRRSCHSR